MKVSLGIILGVLLTLASAWAQDMPATDVPASKQDIEKLLVVLHLRERTQLIMENSRKQSKSMITEILQKDLPEATEDERSQLREVADEMIEGVYKEYPIDALLRDMVPVYQRHLTKSDSDQLIAFYSSPVGQKVLREMPAITSEAMQVSSSYLQPRIEAAIGKLKERAERMAEEDRKKKNATEPKPTAK